MENGLSWWRIKRGSEQEETEEAEKGTMAMGTLSIAELS